MAKQKAEKTRKTNDDSYQYLLEDDIYEYLPFKFSVEDLESDYIGRFNRKMAEGGIEVNEAYEKHLKETGKPVPGVDLRTGEYGLKYAAAGFFDAACQFQKRGEWDKVIANCDKAIELNPRFVLAYTVKAQTHMRKKQYSHAIEAMDNAISYNPVAIAKKMGLEAKAVEVFGEEFLEDMRNLLAHSCYVQGKAYFLKGKERKAILRMDMALSLNPSSVAEIVDGRLAILMETGHWKRALADCNTLIEARYKEPDTLISRGICERELRWFRRSIADFTSVLEKRPDMAAVYAERGITYFNKCDYLRARADLDEALKRGHEDALYYRARSNFYIGDFDDAIADFDRLLTFWGDRENTLMLREQAVDYKRQGVTMHTLSPDGYHRDNSKKADQSR